MYRDLSRALDFPTSGAAQVEPVSRISPIFYFGKGGCNPLGAWWRSTNWPSRQDYLQTRRTFDKVYRGSTSGHFVLVTWLLQTSVCKIMQAQPCPFIQENIRLTKFGLWSWKCVCSNCSFSVYCFCVFSALYEPSNYSPNTEWKCKRSSDVLHFFFQLLE